MVHLGGCYDFTNVSYTYTTINIIGTNPDNLKPDDN